MKLVMLTNAKIDTCKAFSSTNVNPIEHLTGIQVCRRLGPSLLARMLNVQYKRQAHTLRKDTIVKSYTMISTKDDEPSWKRLKRTSVEMTSAEDANMNNSGTATPLVGVFNPLMIAHPSPFLSLTTGSSTSITGSTATKIGTNHTTHITMMHQQHQLESLQMQMDHERDKNRLEQKKLQNTIDKLQQQVELSTKELQQQNDLYTETQENYEKQISDLTTAHRNTLQQNRQLQMQIEQHQYHHISRPQRQRQRCLYEDNGIEAGSMSNTKDYDEEEYDQDLNDDEMVDAEMHTYQVLNQRLQKQIQNYSHNEAVYQQEIKQLKKIVAEKLHSLQEDRDTKKKEQDESDKLYEDAPKTLLQELNTCRIQLATSERHVRQLERQMKYEEQQYNALVQENEALKLQNQRYGPIQTEWHDMQQKLAQTEAENVAYQDFTKQVQRIMNEEYGSRFSVNKNNDRGPPELATIVRFLEKLQRSSISPDTSSTGKRNADTQGNENEMKTHKSLSSTDAMEWAKREREFENDIRMLQKKYDVANHQAMLYQREIESFKSLIQTYEQQMIMMSPKKQSYESSIANLSNNTMNIEYDKLKIEHDSLRDLCKHLEQTNGTLTAELNTCQNELNTKHNEYDQLRAKYQQIREAMQAEKEHRTAIEQQLIVAEQLSGKGSFDPERTRILHITETPLIQALKEEIVVLKRQVDTLLQQKQNSVSSPSDAHLLDTSQLLTMSSTSTMPNPDKVIQRLKEQFKEQIGMFREGVYMMTGYKIDMITTNPPNSSNSNSTISSPDDSKPRPTFRLRSVFAEQEQDQLLLQWPANQDSLSKKSLDILQTDFAKHLSTTSCYDYIAKLHSLPAFLASVQLMLFEKQTIMM